MTALGLALLAALSTPCAPAARAWIAEVFYDAAGDDTDREYVELVNPGSAPVALAGVRLEAGDGSGPGRWSARWTGAAGDTVPPGGRFVVGGARVEPRPQAVATLDLQNGPDAVRLVWPGGAVEVVGWGAHEFAEYACGAPAPDVPSGQSLARVPDDSNAGSNALDFRAAAPSPGRANQVRRDAALAPGSASLDPARPEPGTAVTLAARVRNAGVEPLAAGALRVAFVARGDPGDWPLAEAVAGAPLAPDDTATVAAAALAPPAGRWRLVARVALPGDEAAANDADSLAFRSGPGPLELAEVQFHPAAGEGEWVEVRNRSGAALDPAGFTLADRGGTRGTARPGGGPLAPESLGVLVQDRDAFLARFVTLDPARVWPLAPWPTLNNADAADGIADALSLAEPDGTPCDAMSYSGSGVPPGVTLERRDGGWWPGPAADGTPLAPPRAGAAPGRGFDCAPCRVAAGAPLRVAWSLPWTRARASIEAWDLAGRRVARPLGETLVPGRGERELALGDLPPGLYVLSFTARSDAGEVRSVARALRVGRGAP